MTIYSVYVHSVVRMLPRSSGKVKFDDEPKPPSLSNLISHLDNCKRLPKSASFEAQQASNEQASGNVVPPAAGQRQIMDKFIQRGIDNPKVEMSYAGFRERFVKGVIHDDLPFIFGEKEGMKEVFKYLLPKEYNIPNGTMVGCDAARLYEAIDSALSAQMKVKGSLPLCRW